MQRDQDLLNINGELRLVRKAMDVVDLSLRRRLDPLMEEIAVQRKRKLLKLQTSLLIEKRDLESVTA